MKIDPELSGSEGISRVGRSPNLNESYDRRDRISRSRTHDLSTFGDYAFAITEIGRVVSVSPPWRGGASRIDIFFFPCGQCAL